MSAGRLRERSLLAAERWMCLSHRARQLKQRHNFTPTTTSQNRHQSRRCIRRTQDITTRSIQGRNFSSSSIQRAAPARQPRLPDAPARTRFAPSPTGYLHIGGLRTALFSYLLAKRTGGQFLLRIEDTDQKRLVSDAEARICEDLLWAGLQWDEGPQIGGPFGPHRQSERTAIYQEHAQKLLDDGSAYRCFCTPRSVSEDSVVGAGYVTSGCYQNCSSLSPEVSHQRAQSSEEAFTVRLLEPADAQKRVYSDLVYGKIQRLKRSPAAPQTASEDGMGADASDTVLMKSDGTPTYHFANVVDDHLMQISHVIRGLEWMASTPLHYNIYSAFGWEPPQFAHVGLLVDENQAKLSKRNLDLALDVASMRNEHGVLPHTLNNFLALLGWSNPTDNDVMNLEALKRNFDLKFTRGNTMVRMEKLWYLQKQHVASRCQRALETRSLSPIEDVISQIVAEVQRAYLDYPSGSVDVPVSRHDQTGRIGTLDWLSWYWTTILLADSKSFQNAKQFVERNRYFISRKYYQIPDELPFYDKAGTITSARLKLAANAAMEGYDAMTKATNLEDEGNISNLDPTEVQRNKPFQALDLRDREHSIHRLLSRRAWLAALHDWITSDIPPIEIEYSEKWANELPRPAENSDPETTARLLCDVVTVHTTIEGTAVQQAVVDDEFKREALAQALATRYRVFYAALMKYLREKLCGGLPGPSVSQVMAILGPKECKERIGGGVEVDGDREGASTLVDAEGRGGVTEAGSSKQLNV